MNRGLLAKEIGEIVLSFLEEAALGYSNLTGRQILERYMAAKEQRNDYLYRSTIRKQTMAHMLRSLTQGEEK